MDYQQFIQKNLKKITVGLAIVGVASLTLWYMQHQKSLAKEGYIEQVSNFPDDYANEDQKDEEELEPEPEPEPEKPEKSESTSDKAASKSKPKKKKKKLDPQARMQKLLAKQNKRHGQQQDDASPDYDDQDDSNLDPDSKAWNEFVHLLSTKGIVLRPQILFDFVALEVKAFCGANVTITISKDVNTNQAESLAKDATISRIEGFIPIINNAKYYVLNNLEEDNVDEKSGLDDFGGYDKMKERELTAYKSVIKDLAKIGRNELGFGIITKRASKVRSKYSMSWNMLDYMIFPGFLNKYYKWNINDSLYFSTLYKNFDNAAGNDTSRFSNSRRKIDDTYFNTGNIGNGFIIFLNKAMTKKLCLIQGEFGLYYTDDRIKYRNLKVPKDVDKYNDKVITCQNLWQKPKGKDVIQLWVQGEDSNLFLLHIHTPKSAHTTKEKIEINQIKFDINACSMDKYQEFEAKMNQLSEELNADYLKKFPYHQADVVPGYYGGNDQEQTDLRSVSNPLVIPDKVGREYNDILKKNKILEIKSKYKYINANDGIAEADSDKKMRKSLLKPLTDKFSLITAYLDEQGMEKSKIATLYMMGAKVDKKAKWKLFMRIRGTNVNKENVENYNKRYMKFIEANKTILEESLDILFCDERIAAKKKLIGIFGENMMVLPCYNNNVDYTVEDDGKDDGEDFAKIYNVKDVIPDLFSVELKTSKSKYINEKATSIVRGGKWYFSYNTQTLYVFERISTSGKNPFRLRRILLHTFKM